jgi:hypothetical protein
MDWRRRLRLRELDVRRALNAFTVVGLAAWGRLRRAAGRPLDPVPPRPYRKLFVVGCPRSGTTWLASMLQRHPRVVSAGESHAYETLLGPFLSRRTAGDRGWRVALTRYELLRQTAWGVGLHLYVDRPALYRLVAAARAHREWSDAEAAMKVIEWAFDRFFVLRGGTVDDVFVEKTPRHQFYARRILAQFPEARVVEVVRDGRDVCVSMQMLAASHPWSPASRRVQAETWRRYVADGIALRTTEAFRDRVLQVRYEALHAAAEPEVARVLGFAGLECAPGLVADIVAATDFRRYPRTGPDRPRRKGTVGDWRNHFTAEDLSVFEHVAGDAFRALGYPR